MTAPLDEPGAPRDGEALDEAALGGYLRAHAGLDGPLVVRQFPKGHSNLTYLVQVGDRELVLRRPPFGSKVKSAHDMGREHRVLSALHGRYPAPRPVALCEDPSVLGASFYVMERLRGVIVRKDFVGEPPPPDVVRRVHTSLVERLADLHALDAGAVGLGELGKPEGYVERQVTGWAKRYQASQTDDVPVVEQIARHLAAHLPRESGAALIHNDYKLDNVVLAQDDLASVVGVLDWEMCTLGDPWMDLGTALGYWMDPDDDEALQLIRWAPTTLPGSLSRREVLALYEARTGRAVVDPAYYYAFGLWKTAIVLQQIYYRYKQGLTKDARFAPLGLAVKVLCDQAARALDRGHV
ncbi:MAG: phosphotransferase family protein [Polyangiaceae bacterium]|nr:phosphotransferase family protein [Polyangiaceae bacterium]